MANGIVDQIYILDTSSANLSIPIPTKFRINTIRAWFADSSGKAVFTSANTTQAICVLSASFTPAAVGGFTDEANLRGVIISDLKLPTLTAGTAWIYFS